MIDFESKLPTDLTSRLNRVVGQLGAVQKMADTSASCQDVLVQLQAARRALDSTVASIMVTLIEQCGSSEDAPSSEELARMLSKLM